MTRPISAVDASIKQIYRALRHQYSAHAQTIPSAYSQKMRNLNIDLFNAQNLPLATKEGAFTSYGSSMWLLFLSKHGFDGKSKLSDVAKYMFDKVRHAY